ncbi:hypothetical protein HKD37_03G006986 [Glycine soja]
MKKVQNEIREKIGDAEFCLIVDETRDESKREQMALVLRFVDDNECALVYGSSPHLYGAQLVHFNPMWDFTLYLYSNMQDTTSTTLKNMICSILSYHNLNIQTISGQRYDGAIVFAIEISHWVENDEIETGRGANQIGTLVILDGVLISFQFVKLWELLIKFVKLYQKKSQDILNAICLVSSTKSLIQKLKDFGWDALLEKVKSFSNKKNFVTVQHHYRVDIFNIVIDYQLKELNSRFE